MTASVAAGGTAAGIATGGSVGVVEVLVVVTLVLVVVLLVLVLELVAALEPEPEVLVVLVVEPPPEGAAPRTVTCLVTSRCRRPGRSPSA